MKIGKTLAKGRGNRTWRRVSLALMLGIVLSFASVPTPSARDLNAELAEAQAALSAGEYDRAYHAFLEHADDNALSQFTLALFHQFGWGRPEDPAEACRWHEKAAAGRIPAAEHFLAECLVRGTHAPADPEGAALWYRRAAEDGHVISLCHLAELHMSGRGVARDPKAGLDLCRPVAEGDSNPAKLHMASFHLEGPEEIRDLVAATGWLQAAAQARSAEASYRLGVIERDGLGKGPNAGAALAWFEQAAAWGYAPAYLPTGQLYFDAPIDPDRGRQRPEDVAKAYLWLSAALRATQNPEERAQASGMIETLRGVMPPTWLPDLDAKVERHFAELEQNTPSAR